MAIGRNASGFTMLELIIAVAIIGVLSAISMNAYHAYVIRTKLVAAQEEISQALNQYGLDKDVSPATGALDELVKQGYLSSLPKDPWSGTADWNYSNDGTWLVFSPKSHPSQERTLASFGLSGGNGFDSKRAAVVRAMRQEQFPTLSPSDVKYLTPAQLAAMTSWWWFSQIPPEVMAMLSKAQIQAIPPSVLARNAGKLTASQIGWMSAKQFAAVKGGDPLTNLLKKRPDMLSKVTPSQIASVTNAWWMGQLLKTVGSGLSTQQLAAISPAAIGQNVHMLTASQIGALSSAQLAAVSGGQPVVVMLQKRPDMISKLSPSQISSIQPPWWYSQIPANVLHSMSPAQIRAMPSSICNSLKSKLSATQQSWCAP